MKINEILNEAGAMSAFLKGAGLEQSAAALGASAAGVNKPRGGTITKTSLAALAAPSTTSSNTPKPLLAFSEILPKDVSVIRRDPLVIRYQRQDYQFNPSTKHWGTVAGKTIPRGIEELLTAWADDINEFDPPATTAVTNVATLDTKDGKAILTSNGTWYINNRAITDPVSIDFLNSHAKSSGQIK